MAGPVATPTVSDVEFVDRTMGSVRADITWDGQANADAIAQCRIRFVVRDDLAASPAPDRATVAGWAEVTDTLGALQGGFYYYDKVVGEPNAGDWESVTDIQNLPDEAIMEATQFANANAVWAMARNEIP